MAPTTHSSGFPGNRVKALLRAGRPAFGVFATIPSVAIMAASELSNMPSDRSIWGRWESISR
jgi:hypothetical protein